MRNKSCIRLFVAHKRMVKSKFSISPEEMARVYTMLATEDGYEGFLYDEKGSEVKANKSAYDKDTQKTLIEILVQKTGI